MCRRNVTECLGLFGETLRWFQLFFVWITHCPNSEWLGSLDIWGDRRQGLGRDHPDEAL